MQFPYQISAITLLALVLINLSLVQPGLSLPATASSAAKKYEQFEMTISSVGLGLTRPKNLACGSAYEVWIRRTALAGSGHTTAACAKMVDYFQGLTSEHNAVDLWIVCPDNAAVKSVDRGIRPTKLAFSYFAGQGVDVRIVGAGVEQQPAGVLRIENVHDKFVVEVPVKLGAAVRDDGNGDGTGGVDVLISYFYCT